MLIQENGNSRDRVFAAFNGTRTDIPAVTCPYTSITYRDHWKEITGQHPWSYYEWCIADPEKHAQMYPVLDKAMPFDIFYPCDDGKSTVERQKFQFVVKNDLPYYYDAATDILHPLPAEPDKECEAPNETQHVFNLTDIKERLRITKAEEQIREGRVDYLKECVRQMGGRRFIFTSWIINTVYSCTWHVGMSNLFSLMMEQPQLIDDCCKRILEYNIERVRALAFAGGDAVFIDDALSTSDMISVHHYERFSLPYLKQTVEEIHKHGMKAVVIYFGGIEDRLDLILQAGADGLIMETSMKGFSNDFEQIGKRIGDKLCLFGNIDPVSVLQDAAEAEAEQAILKQIRLCRMLPKSIVSTGSPITPGTPLSRIQRYIAWTRESAKGLV